MFLIASYESGVELNYGKWYRKFTACDPRWVKS